ncbi:UDP-galactopyranose/dTDP-fucopyranose mutase family protein [Lactiplantibacillus plantarum]|uniref:UDP-galactopyranose/dTDP-fucopyranose mutase family protein n=1 Tax=Lactiplantibacillus plantarum TaxID=1590 RepID=UPI003BA1E955
MNEQYDYLVVGAGLFGAVFAHEAALRGKRVKVIEKRDHIAGNIYTKEVAGIQVHQYGAHIFHTSDREIWDYVNQFAEFNRYTNSPVANYKGHMYNLPFNMNTFSELWGVRTPAEAAAKIAEQRAAANLGDHQPRNLEEQAIALIGTDIYKKLIKGYTEKQWGQKATDLPAFIIRRLPVRYTYDNNYFNDTYQGNAVVNYTDAETPYTRVIEHKHFEFGKGDADQTVITREFPANWQRGDEPYYPVNNQTNNTLYKQYAKLAAAEPQVIFGGRLGQYRYYDMHQVIHAALVTVASEFATTK